LTKKESAFGEQNLQGRRSFPGDSREEQLDNTLLKEWCLNWVQAAPFTRTAREERAVWTQQQREWCLWLYVPHSVPEPAAGLPNSGGCQHNGTGSDAYEWS